MSTATRTPALGVAPVSPWSRLYGFGSVYAKTLRDSRLAFLIVAGFSLLLMLYLTSALPLAYPTLKSRQDMAHLATDLPPIMQGMTSKPVNIATIGGYMQWKYGYVFAMVVGVWSILALSGTLAGEARQGSLDIVAAAPAGKRRIAIEKLAAHLTAVVGTVVLMAASAYGGSRIFGDAQLGDALPFSAVAGYALWVLLIGLVSGSVAWALGPIVGRASAVGVAVVVLVGGWAVSGYAQPFDFLRPVASLSWFWWTSNHLPLAGQYDWPSLLPVALITAVLLAVGIEGFARRDLGVSSAIPVPAMPGALLGTSGPIRRSLGDRLPLAIAWGLGLGIFAGLLAASSPTFASKMQEVPATVDLLKKAFPGYDIVSAGGFLQLMFVLIAFIVVGLGTCTLIAGWASEESERRLEVLLATPVGRGRWALASGFGVWLAIAVMTGRIMLGVGLGAAMAGGDVLTPLLGTIPLGLWGAAVAGIGFAVGGLWRTSLAAEVAAIYVIATFLIAILGPGFRAPGWFNGLAVTNHLGQTMIGAWDWSGVLACAVIAVGGLALGAWGLRRRDVE
jgi:ABC-2 type transport system permease protein